jgi:hypothetical protein
MEQGGETRLTIESDAQPWRNRAELGQAEESMAPENAGKVVASEGGQAVIAAGRDHQRRDFNHARSIGRQHQGTPGAVVQAEAHSVFVQLGARALGRFDQ